MVRVVEISAEAVSGVRRDVAAVCEPIDTDWYALRSRARGLGVPTSGFGDVLAARDRLGSHVLPVVPQPFRRTPLGDGSTVLTWEQTNDGDVEADRQETKKSRGIGGWFEDASPDAGTPQ